MSGVSGRTRTNEGFTKETGFFEAEVIAINPDRERLEKILGTTLEKDPEYLGEDDGVKKLNIVFWLKDVDTGKIKSVRFYLKDKERVNSTKEGDGKTKKKQYINSVGATSWADKPDNLFDWFKAREFRVAHEGEEELYNFIVNWLNKLDTRDPEATLLFDWNKLMKGNVKDISDQIGGDYARSVVCLCTVREVEKDGTKKTYEQVYNKEFLAGYVMKEIRTRAITPATINAALTTQRNKRSRLQRFLIIVNDSQYGVKDYYTLGSLQEYDPSKNPAAGDKPHIQDDNTDY